MSLWGKVRGIFGSNPAAAAQASPRDLLAAEVEAALRAMPAVASVGPTPDAYGLIVAHGGKQKTLFLDNLFDETRDLAPEQRRERIARLLRNLDAPDRDAMSWEEVRPKPAPLLGNGVFVAAYKGTRATISPPPTPSQS
jgi:hypothetical protein